MTLESNFRFSQSNLSAYLSCPRRFYLRYVQRLDWPAMISEPVLEREKHLENGSRFHVLVQQHIAGMQVEEISRTIQDSNLDRWWHNFLDFYPNSGLGGKHTGRIHVDHSSWWFPLGCQI